jgi:hypothetical protein
VERINISPQPNETSLNLAVPENQLCRISDLNELPAEQEDRARVSGLATDGFVAGEGATPAPSLPAPLKIPRTWNLIRWANSSSAFARIFAKDANLFD